MRTTTTDRIVHSICGLLGKNSWEYSVQGTIVFKFDSASWEPDMSELRCAIVAVDMLHPWINKNRFTGETPESIKYLSDTGDIRANNWHVPEKECSFTIEKGGGRLNKGQLHAYEKYLAKIAEELFKRDLPHVVSVRWILHTCNSGEFMKENS